MRKEARLAARCRVYHHPRHSHRNRRQHAGASPVVGPVPPHMLHLAWASCSVASGPTDDRAGSTRVRSVRASRIQCKECTGSTMGYAYSRPTRARAPRYAFFKRSESSSRCTSPWASHGTETPRPGWNKDAKSSRCSHELDGGGISVSCTERLPWITGGRTHCHGSRLPSATRSRHS